MLAKLSQMSSTEFADFAPDLAYIPVGATEQHGSNLGMGIDYAVAEEIAFRSAAAAARRIVVTPPIPFGLSDSHMDFPGTVSISFDTFRSMCIDVCRSLAQHGIRRYVFVNGHMGNMHALAVISAELKYKWDIDAAVAFWFDQAADEIRKAVKTERWGHACEIECSVAMASVPHLVKYDMLTPGDMIEDYKPYSDRYKPFALSIPLSFHERTRNGVFGDATQASAEVGEAILAVAVARLSEFSEAF